LAADILDAVWDQCKQILGKYHEINPLHAGMKQAELRQKLFPKTPLAIADGIIGALEHENRIRNVADRYSLPAFSVQLTKRQAAIREKLLNLYEEADINVPNVEDILLGFQPKEKEDCHRVLESLISGGELVMLSPQLVIHSSVYERILSVTKAWFAKHEILSLSEFRDLLDTSRKYALAMLEYYDRNKLTKKEGDVRKATTNLNAE
ncbi:MAG: SelB C-terminal domain-containing protein, partial [Oscillospiraceae bacterium]|nr:SelB C-terminal domain-containing protein [Oscillospiraceae bacterium]